MDKMTNDTPNDILSDEALNARIPEARASFKQMKDATTADYQRIHAAEDVLEGQVADRLLTYLDGLDISNGAPITVLDHSLLTATLAAEDERSDEYVACALLHDIGDLLCPSDHGAFAAAIVRPYVSEAHWFMTRYHPEFQMENQTANSRADQEHFLRHRDSPHFDLTRDFCRRYDQRAFDPSLKRSPLEDFAPILRSVFRTPNNHRTADAT
ncbi:MAG: phosphohydrolase [Pseudomonadota bacterium]